MRGAVLVIVCAAGCVQAPSVLRSADLSGVTTIALISRSGSSTAGAALEEELRSELPNGHRFALVPTGAQADATLAIEAQRWWADERELLPAAPIAFPPRLRRVETMEATFHLVVGPTEVTETYRRSNTGAPRGDETGLWNDDLVAANAVQIIAAFVTDLSLDAHGAPRAARPAPAETAPEAVPAPL